MSHLVSTRRVASNSRRADNIRLVSDNSSNQVVQTRRLVVRQQHRDRQQCRVHRYTVGSSRKRQEPKVSLGGPVLTAFSLRGTIENDGESPKAAIINGWVSVSDYGYNSYRWLRN